MRLKRFRAEAYEAAIVVHTLFMRGIESGTTSGLALHTTFEHLCRDSWISIIQITHVTI